VSRILSANAWCGPAAATSKTSVGRKNPPADVQVKSVEVPKFVEPAERSSYRSSPAELCSEIGE
jgi:hypothetical protein